MAAGTAAAVSCSFGFAVAVRTAAAATAAGALRSCSACCCSAGFAGSCLRSTVAAARAWTEAVEARLSAAGIAVTKAGQPPRTLDSEACPNEPPSSPTSTNRP